MVTEEKSLGNDLCISEGGQISVTSEFKLPAGSNVVGLVFLTRCWGGFFLWRHAAEILSESLVFFWCNDTYH